MLKRVSQLRGRAESQGEGGEFVERVWRRPGGGASAQEASKSAGGVLLLQRPKGEKEAECRRGSVS